MPDGICIGDRAAEGEGNVLVIFGRGTVVVGTSVLNGAIIVWVPASGFDPENADAKILPTIIRITTMAIFLVMFDGFAPVGFP